MAARRRPRVRRTAQVSAAAPALVPDRYLTGCYAGRLARLWTARPAYLLTQDGPVMVGHAPAGASVEITQVCRSGPLIADLVVLATPLRAPELCLAAPWAAVDLDLRKPSGPE